MQQNKITDQLPPAFILCWIKRKSGPIYIGYRLDNPLAKNPDASRDCYWYGSPANDPLRAAGSNYHFYGNFSDVTVESWALLTPPDFATLPEQSAEEMGEETRESITNLETVLP